LTVQSSFLSLFSFPIYILKSSILNPIYWYTVCVAIEIPLRGIDIYTLPNSIRTLLFVQKQKSQPVPELAFQSSILTLHLKSLPKIYNLQS
jgi:hypothetical protein